MSREVKVGNEWVRVAGRGKAEYGASHYQTGTISSDAIAAYTKVTQEVTFEKEMPDSDYIVNFDSSTSMRIAANAISKTKTGFKIELFNVTSTESSAVTVKWQAFKLYSDKEYDGLLDDVATNTTDIKALKTRTQAVCTSVRIKANGLTARKSGKVVTVNGATQFSEDLTRGSWVEIATLPSGYRPSNYEYGTAVVDSGEGSVTCPIDVDASGSMRIFIYEKSIPTTLSLNDRYSFISLCFTQN